jgi:dipeptidyl-peptidase-4
MKKWFVIFVLAALMISLNATAQKELTLEDIYQNNTFRINTLTGISWMKNGNYYTSLKINESTGLNDIIKFSTLTGEVEDTLVHGALLKTGALESPIQIHSYTFTNNESKVLISTDNARIYRRSSISGNYIYDLKSGQLTVLEEDKKQSFATFSPDGSKVAFVRENNLFFKDISTRDLTQVTNDGEINKIINGSSDWVYEEELSLSKAFFWSPDGSKIAFLKFNESEVPLYNMQKWNALYPEDYKFKYPKAGEKNSVVSIHIYDLRSGQTTRVKLGEEQDVYFARLQWLPVGQVLSVIRLNRLQNQMDIFHFDTKTENISLVYSEKTDTYIDIDQVDDLTYLKDGNSFIMSSERSGFKHLYRYSIDGKLINQITYGAWAVTDFEGIDEKKQVLYYTSSEVSSIERHLYVVSLRGRGKKRLTKVPGTHTASFSPDYKFYISTHSNVDQPSTTSLYKFNGREVKVLAENNDYLRQSLEYGFAHTEFFRIPINTGDSLNAYIMKPANFTEEKRYPVLMYVYGGPGSQNVMNRWNSNMWHHLLTQKGYLVVCVDNRGTGGKGRSFQHITYKSLGKYESEDQINAAKYIAEWPFVDKDRIGIWGWSYGGYMSSLCLMLGNDVFKAAIAVAPVTNWRFYDTIYTERYLQKPQDNPEGYDDFSPVNHADKLKGALMLIHGTGDDNVHFQNTVELQNALIRANKQFESFFYPDRNHGIYGGNTRLHLYTMMTKFIVDHL